MKTELLQIPGVGKNMKQHFVELGYHFVEDLIGANPEEMYLREIELTGQHIDRCVLYVYRLAVYMAETEHLDPEMCQWWKWKD